MIFPQISLRACISSPTLDPYARFRPFLRISSQPLDPYARRLIPVPAEIEATPCHPGERVGNGAICRDGCHSEHLLTCKYNDYLPIRQISRRQPCNGLHPRGFWIIFVENVEVMSDVERIQLFENKKVRTVWVEKEDKWYFVLEDVIEVLTGSRDPKQYVKRMKLRDHELAKGWVQIVPLLSIQTEGGPQKMRCANLEGTFRVIQSIPSKKAEPFKRWMAQVAAERINQMIDPERSIDQAVVDYRRLGYSEAWINRRIKSIEIRKGLTDEWKKGGVTQEMDFAFLTDLMSKTWSGMTTKEYKKYKGLTKENLRDNMTNMELLLNALAEETATEISKQRNPEGLSENAGVAKEGAEVAKSARKEVEKRIGHSVVSPEKAIDHIQSLEELPFPKPDRQ